MFILTINSKATIANSTKNMGWWNSQFSQKIIAAIEGRQKITEGAT